MTEILWWRLKAGELNALAQRNAAVILPVVGLHVNLRIALYVQSDCM